MKIINVVCGIIEKDGTVLAAKRASQKSNAGLWEFPGGKIDSGETPPQALVRELVEELGIVVAVGESLGRFEYRDGLETLIALFAYRCRIISGDVVALEHEELAWVDQNEARRLSWSAADLPILERVFT